MKRERRVGRSKGVGEARLFELDLLLGGGAGLLQMAGEDAGFHNTELKKEDEGTEPSAPHLNREWTRRKEGKRRYWDHCELKQQLAHLAI